MKKPFKKIYKEIFHKDPPRERLKLLYHIKTDKAFYNAYNTQTVERDWVNIEIERIQINKDTKTKIILEDEIFDDSWGACGGDSFYSLVLDSRRHLHSYIKKEKEFIIAETDLL